MRNFMICTPHRIFFGSSRRMRWAEHVARMGEEDKSIQGFDGKT